MIQTTNNKQYDLVDRCLAFAKRVNLFINTLSLSISNKENAKQLVRSAGSVGANYIEANESLSKKDCLLRLRIAKKEAKESQFWLELITPAPGQIAEKDLLIKETKELVAILGAIIEKVR